MVFAIVYGNSSVYDHLHVHFLKILKLNLPVMPACPVAHKIVKQRNSNGLIIINYSKIAKPVAEPP